MNRPRAVDAARFGLGLLAATRPDTVLRFSHGPTSAGERLVVRVLGGRYLVQSAGGYALNRRWVPALDAGIDLVHALSMTGLAVWAPRHRRLALLSATTAITFAATDLSHRVQHPTSAGHGHGDQR